MIVGPVVTIPLVVVPSPSEFHVAGELTYHGPEYPEISGCERPN